VAARRPVGAANLKKVGPLLAKRSAVAKQFHPITDTQQNEIGDMIVGLNHQLTTLGTQHEALRLSEYRSRAIIDASPVPMALNDEHGNITFLNRAFCQQTGYTLSDIPTLSDWWPRAYPDPRYRRQVAGNWQKNLKQAKRPGQSFLPMEINIRCKDDSVRVFQVTATFLDETFSGNHLVTLYDITESKKSAATIRELSLDFVSFLENTSDFIYFKDKSSRFRFCSQTLAKITGHASWRDMIGKHDLEVFPPDIAKIYNEEELPIFRNGLPLLNKIDPYFDASGRPGWVETNKWPLLDKDGQVVGLFGVSRDVTARRQAELDRDVLQEKIQHLAFVDPLTQLPNRRLLDDRLGQAMAASKRSGLHGALMFLDLDNFKPLNDTLGHGAGDLLLVEVAKRLTECVRETDSVARLGGDEFVVLLKALDVDKGQSIDQASAVAEKVRAALAVPYHLNVTLSNQQVTTVEHHCSASIGVVVFLNDEVSPIDLMKCADAAMYQAKDAGRNSIRFYGLS
jgi:diguanylate cyclase (GGDEF)-like protein/PAS domain S-box-containing protein